MYWRNGVLGQADGGAGADDESSRSDGVLDRRCEEDREESRSEELRRGEGV